MKLLYLFITACMARTIARREYITAIYWTIGRDQTGLQVGNNKGGTCITTGTYSNNCVLPADVITLPLTSPTTTTPSITKTTTSMADARCVVACATQTCPGIRTGTHCFCNRIGDIGYCMAGDCGIPYPTATVLAEKLCGTNSHPIDVYTAN